MNDNTKTGLFVGIAALCGLMATLSTPRSNIDTKTEVEKLVGKPLFEQFTDPSEASSLEIIKYDADMGSLKPFELTRDKKTGAWVMPSHDSYPADAATQVSKVANAFVGLKIINLASTSAEDQKLFGVVEPDASKLKVGDTDVGLLVRMSDDKGEKLVNVVIGKTVRDDESKRYVRRAGTDPIYTAVIDTKVLTTDFAAWIEGDLLKLSSNDVDTLTIRDYNILPTQRGAGALQKNFDAVASYSTRDNKWSAKSILTYTSGEPKERTLAEDEQLNTTKLNEMKNVLDNLKIVGVARKPQGLAADLKAENGFLDDNAKILSLAKKGFIPGQTEGGAIELYSTSGELAVTLNDGVEYLLRFGNTTAGSESEDGKEADAAGVALKRTLFVTSRVDESRYPEPPLKDLPKTIEELDAMTPASSESAPPMNFVPKSNASGPDGEETGIPSNIEPAGEMPTESVPLDSVPGPLELKPLDPSPSGETPALKDGSQNRLPASKSAKSRFVAFQDEQATAEEAKPETNANEKPAAEQTTAPELSPAEPKPEDAKPAESKPAETEQEAKERLEAAREKITKENDRLIDARNDKLKAAKKRSAELNARFAEWYYEISDADYKKLRVSLEDLIQKK